jgi:Putative viral replication protein.
MMKNTRAYQVTINNPSEKQLEHENIKTILSKSKVEYYCFSDEIAPETGTYHTHLFVLFTNPIRMSTLAKRFNNSHCEPIDTKIKGIIQSNIDYIQKVGKHADKKACQVDGTFYEAGIRPVEKEIKVTEKLTDVIYKYIQAGMNTAEMIRADKRLINKIKDIEATRQLFLAEEFMVKERKISTIYLYGKPATGKTTYVYKNHNPENICRITNYSTTRGVLFDNYQSDKHNILVFEDWDSITTPIHNMLAWLDKWGTTLPARYADRVATYNTVYIISNIPYEIQYSELRHINMDLYLAWDRRINTILEFKKTYNGSIEIIKHR